MEWLDQFVPGGILVALAGAGFAALRFLPGLISEWFRRLFTSSLVTRDPQLTQWLSAWIGQTEYGKTARWIDAELIDEGAEASLFTAPGLGVHSFIHEGTRYWLRRNLEENGIAGLRTVLSISTVGRDRRAIEALMQHALQLREEARRGKNAIYVNQAWGGWQMIRLFDARPASSVFLPPGMMESIIGDADRYWSGRDQYTKRALPYRRGHLYYGPPGNGKSSIVQAIATETRVPIYLLSFSDKDLNDQSIIAAVGRLPKKCILLIEDVEKIEFEKTDVSMPGLLNAVDGPLASEGRLLILTANSIDSVSPILLRPGRIDQRWRIGNPERTALHRFASRFSLAPDAADSLIGRALGDEWNMAEFQQALLAMDGIYEQ